MERWRFSKAPDEVVATVEPFTVPRFRHRLADYVNGMVDAGFRVDQMAEPRPDQDQVDAHPWLRRWQRHAALVLLMKGRRPVG